MFGMFVGVCWTLLVQCDCALSIVACLTHRSMLEVMLWAVQGCRGGEGFFNREVDIGEQA